MQNVINLKRGDLLFKEGDKADRFYVIQSGRLSLELNRGGVSVQIAQVNSGQIVGENFIFSNGRRPLSAKALVNTAVVEIPNDVIKAQSEDAPAMVKLLIKNLVEKSKTTLQEIKALKMEKDTSPCPQIFVPRLFAILHMVTRHIGKDLGQNHHQVSWSALKTYAVRMFLEAPTRVEGCLEILKKLGYLEFIMVKNDEGEEELSDLIFKELQICEDFSEFYQYHLYKPGRSEMMFPDRKATLIAKGFAEIGKDRERDHHGAVTLPLNELVEHFKTNHDFEFKLDQLDYLQMKGLFVKRKSQNEEMSINYDIDEFSKVSRFWEILLEIEKWNENGRIQSFEEEASHAKKSQGIDNCPQCQGEIQKEHKFCPGCGHALAA